MQETGSPGEGGAEMPNSRQGDTPSLTLAGSHHHPWARVRMQRARVTGGELDAAHHCIRCPQGEGTGEILASPSFLPNLPLVFAALVPAGELAHRVHLSRSAGEQTDPRAIGSRTSTNAVCISRCTPFLLYVQGRTSHGEGRARR